MMQIFVRNIRASGHNLTFNRNMSTSAKIGFIGLGNMGKEMATNLVLKGRNVAVYDINEKSMDEVASHGAQKCGSLKELASQVTHVITMVPSAAQVKKIYLDNDGLLANLPSKSFLIDTSTIGPVAALEVLKEVKAKGHTMVDAPVSGGVPAATAASLTFMVGGDEESFKLAEPILKDMGKKVLHCGDNGQGQFSKVCNNLLCGCNMASVAETFRLANAGKSDLQKLTDVVNISSGRCWPTEVYHPVPGITKGTPSNRDYAGGFFVSHMLKDLRLAIAAAEEYGLSVPMAKRAAELYQQLVDDGYGEIDFGSIYKYGK